MKVVCQDHVDLAVPVERTYEFVKDSARWPVWLAFVVNAHPLQDCALPVGAELRICMAAGKRRRQEVFEVTRHVRNAFLSLESELSAARRVDFRFEQRGTLSRLSLAVGYPVFGGGIASAWDALFVRPMVQRAVRESLVHVRGALDAHDVSLNSSDTAFDILPVPTEKLSASPIAEPAQVA